MTLAVVASLSIPSLLAMMTVQQRDVAGAPVVVAGDGEIAGVVVAADGGQPLRRAIVTLAGGSAARSVLTDDGGRFTFARVAAGSYTVTAT